MRLKICSTIAALACVSIHYTVMAYHIDDSKGPARTFDGIGAISGGGATSVLLPFYPEQQQSEILDYLFLPNFGASLHMIKVEIGGDAQSTDGSEPSHMHDPTDENYERGYEWFIMSEAKKRNPSIKTFGLPWAWPQWVSCTPGTMENCTGSPYSYPNQSATYITNWIQGAKDHYGIEIDYVGSWNERDYNATYLKTLRKFLDDAGFVNTKIVAADNHFEDISKSVLEDSDLADAVWGIGAHYPGTTSGNAAEETGKPLWSSEEASTYNNAIGAGCWARVLNQNYVNGNMTSSICWNLLAAYMKGTMWYRAGLMTALTPWSGAYGSIRAQESFSAGAMIWATAHTTQFTEPGWSYLANGTGAGTGSGFLQLGGSYVTIKNFDTGDFSIIIEKMSRNQSFCVRPHVREFETASENATFLLGGELAANTTTLYLWRSHWAHSQNDTTVEFEQQSPVVISNGQFSLEILVDSVYTLTTLNTGQKGAHSTPPNPALFPEIHVDDFSTCAVPSNPALFSDQNGIWECADSGDEAHGTVIQQRVPLQPIVWGGDIRPHTLIGHRDAKNTSLIIDARITQVQGSLFVGVHMQGTNDYTGNDYGTFFAVDSTDSSWAIYDSLEDVGKFLRAKLRGNLRNSDAYTASPSSDTMDILPGVWHSYRIDINGTIEHGFFVNVWVDDNLVVENFSYGGMTTSGHGALGTIDFGHFTQFDNLQLYSAYSSCHSELVPGATVAIVECSSEIGPTNASQWAWAPETLGGWTGSFYIRSNSSLCIESIPVGNDAWPLQINQCDSSNPYQKWEWNFHGISPDYERKSIIFNPDFNRCFTIDSSVGPDIGSPMYASRCMEANDGQLFWFDHDEAEIGNEWSSTCLGVC